MGGVFQAGDEEDVLGRQLAKPGVVDVAAVHDDDRARIEAQGAGHPDVVALAVGDHDHAGQVAVVIEQAVQFDGALGAAELGPVEHGGAQVDDRRIQADELVFKPELAAAGDLGLAAAEQGLEHGAVQLPRPMLVGVGQGRAGRRLDPQVLELALATAQPPADLSQRVGAPELAEQHGHELAPAGEAARVALRPGLLDQGLELGPRKQLEELAEHAGEFPHGWASFVWCVDAWRHRPHHTAGGSPVFNPQFGQE